MTLDEMDQAARTLLHKHQVSAGVDRPGMPPSATAQLPAGVMQELINCGIWQMRVVNDRFFGPVELFCPVN